MVNHRFWMFIGMCAGLLTCGSVWASGAWTPEAHTGWATLSSQFLHVHFHLSSTGKKLSAGTIDKRSLYMQLEYGITDRADVYVGLPWGVGKYVGTDSHFYTDKNGVVHMSKLDDGRYHSAFGDLTLGFQYRLDLGDWAVTPFVAYTTPSNHYDYHGHAAIGVGQNSYEIGFNAAKVLAPPLDRMYVEFGYGYSFLQGFAGVHPKRNTFTGDLGYLVSDRFSLRLFAVGQKTLGGLDFPDDYAYFFDMKTNAELFKHEDATQRADFIEAGVGAAYAFSGRTFLFGGVYHTFWGENVTEVQYAVNFGITHQF